MVADPPAPSRSRSTCSSLRMNGGSRRRTCGSPAVPARMSALEQLRLHLLGRARWCAGPCRKPSALEAGDRTDDAGLADVGADALHVGEQVFALDGVDARPRSRRRPWGRRRRWCRGSRACRAAVMRRRQQQRRAREAVAQRLGGGDHVGHHAVAVGGERLAGAAHAALHLVEDQQRAGLVAALAQRREEFLRPCRTRRPRPAPARRSPPRCCSVTCVGDVGDVARAGSSSRRTACAASRTTSARAPGDGAGGGGAAVKAAARPRRPACARVHA